MIIQCPKCTKSFELDQNLITQTGRLLQCGSCDNQWFFKKKENYLEDRTINKIKHATSIESKITDTIEPTIDNNEDDFKLLDSVSNKKKNSIPNTKKNHNTLDSPIYKNFIAPENIKKKIGILNIILVFIISVTALILTIDTFQSPLGNIFPNIEFLLYNLYETLKDVKLFLKDLF